MRSLLIDELMPADVENLAEHLDRTFNPSTLEGVYWLELPPDLLAGDQIEHRQCGPYRVAMVLEEESLRLELLVRAQESLHCSCTAYATPAQRAFLIDYVDRLIEELGLRT
jgi:hypothetical protein